LAEGKEDEMSSRNEKERTWGLSVDEWAVVAALVLALLVRVGILTSVPW
jgi:hypothetical protein